MLYSCTHMATVGVKGLISTFLRPTLLFSENCTESDVYLVERRQRVQFG